jgi:3-phenylpropionate/trans-cinnamate dioxygenase ferredoxin component
MSHWFEAARVGEIANRTCKVIAVNGSDVAVFNLDGEYFAIEDLCTHLGSDLHSGWVEGDRAVCPSHLAEFSIRTGEALKAPAYEGVHSFPVRVREGVIEIHDDRQ